MLVCVTGGTGFVGSHSTAAVLRTGAKVRLLVRDPAAARAVLGPLGVEADAVDLVVGDVTDREAVEAAVRGCDTVLHAAAVYSFDPRRRAEMHAVNARATDLVLDAGVRFGCERIIHVSSVVAMYPARGRVVDADAPVGGSSEPYLASKAAAEEIARRRQAAGAPVLISYPPALLGPHDPRLGDQTSRLRDLVRGLMPIWPTGGFPVGDVRDTAALHARLLSGAASDSGRYFGPNSYLTTRGFVREARAATGRSLPAVFLPAATVLPVGRAAGALQRFVPWHIPVEYGAVHVCACATRVGENADSLGLTARPVAQTMTDTVAWLHDAGHLTARQAGAAATAAAAAAAAA